MLKGLVNEGKRRKIHCKGRPTEPKEATSKEQRKSGTNTHTNIECGVDTTRTYTHAHTHTHTHTHKKKTQTIVENK